MAWSILNGGQAGRGARQGVGGRDNDRGWQGYSEGRSHTINKTGQHVGGQPHPIWRSLDSSRDRGRTLKGDVDPRDAWRVLAGPAGRRAKTMDVQDGEKRKE